MIARIRYGVCCILMTGFGCALADEPPPAPTPFILVDGQLSAPDRIVIKLRKPAHGKPRDVSARHMRQTLQLPPGARIRESRYDRWRRATDAGRSRRSDLINPAASRLIVELDDGVSLSDVIAHLRAHPLVEYAEPDGVGFGGGVPSDPAYPLQWHHARTQSTGAWAFTTGSTNVTVAVLDTGIALAEAEFAGRLVPGYNFVSDNTNPADDHGHGTAVAGVIGANANNARHVAGVDWTCKIMPVKVLNSGNWGYYSWWADGVDFAVANGAKVINLSAGGSDSLTALTDAIRNAVSNGVIFITITHNHSSGTITYPGTLPESITIGATDSDDTRSSFSNWGNAIDLVAPGRDIYTVGRTGNLEYWWGTSFSAPQVAGVAALLASVRPGITQEEVRTFLAAGAADQVGDAHDTAGWDTRYGWGRLNTSHTLQLALTVATLTPDPAGPHVTLRWPATSHGGIQHPYRIHYTDSLPHWTTLTNYQNISYADGMAQWIDDGNETDSAPGNIPARYYRIHIAP